VPEGLESGVSFARSGVLRLGPQAKRRYAPAKSTGTMHPDTREEMSAPASARASTDDLLLVRRLLDRDEAAFESLVERYHAALVRLAILFVGDQSVAEEVAQDTWVAVLNGLRSFEGRASLKTWIFSILTNKAKTRGVRERRSIPFSALAGPDATDDDAAVDPARFASTGRWTTAPARWDDHTPERLLLGRESRVYLEAALADLPPNQRAVVTLRDIEGLEPAEVCNVLDISETNQRVLLHRGRSRLRAALERYLARR
jgi:RNA polymerase sigma-70 factor (ECF subfamily)